MLELVGCHLPLLKQVDHRVVFLQVVGHDVNVNLHQIIEFVVSMIGMFLVFPFVVSMIAMFLVFPKPAKDLFGGVHMVFF